MGICPSYLGINNYFNDKNKMIKDLNNYRTYIDKFVNDKLYENEINIRCKFSKDKKCGDGVCLFQNPKYTAKCSGVIEFNGLQIKVMLMCRVKTKKIWQPQKFPEC